MSWDSTSGRLKLSLLAVPTGEWNLQFTLIATNEVQFFEDNKENTRM